MDNESEINFIKMLESKYKDKTKIIISHRLEALKFCNKIYDINQKRLVWDV